MVRTVLNPDLVSSIIHEIFSAQKSFFSDDQGRLIVPRSDADLIMEQIIKFGAKAGLCSAGETWSGRYLVGLYHQKYDPVPKLIGAVLMAYAQTMDEVPVSLVGVEEIMIMAKPGSIRPGTVINGQSQKCKRAVCPVYFIRTAPNQLYCCTRCGVLDRKEKSNSNGHGGPNEK